MSLQEGLYFVGLALLYAMSSSMVHGVGRAAKFVARAQSARGIRRACCVHHHVGRSARIIGAQDPRTTGLEYYCSS